MYNIIISVASLLLGLVIFSFALGGGEFRPLYGFVPALFVGLGIFVYLSRRSLGQIQAIMEQAQQLLMAVSENQTNPKVAIQKVDEAIELLKSGYAIEKWQIWTKAQLDGQIGQLYFMTERYDDAEPFLVNSIKRNWMARAMLGVLHYKRRNYEKMEAVFEEAAQANKKESLLWNLYAYCLWKINKRDEAIQVLGRAVEHVGSDERTKTNLLALQNNKKMKMRGWNMMWYQFHLDKPPAQPQQPLPQQRTQFRRR